MALKIDKKNSLEQGVKMQSFRWRFKFSSSLDELSADVGELICLQKAKFSYCSASFSYEKMNFKKINFGGLVREQIIQRRAEP